MKLLAPSIIGVFALVGGLGTAQAQTRINMAKYTCEDLQRASLEERVINAAWFSGYVNGRNNRTTVDERVFKARAEAIVDYCTKNPKATVLSAINAVTPRRARNRPYTLTGE